MSLFRLQATPRPLFCRCSVVTCVPNWFLRFYSLHERVTEQIPRRGCLDDATVVAGLSSAVFRDQPGPELRRALCSLEDRRSIILDRQRKIQNFQSPGEHPHAGLFRQKRVLEHTLCLEQHRYQR